MEPGYVMVPRICIYQYFVIHLGYMGLIMLVLTRKDTYHLSEYTFLYYLGLDKHYSKFCCYYFAYE